MSHSNLPTLKIYPFAILADMETRLYESFLLLQPSQVSNFDIEDLPKYMICPYARDFLEPIRAVGNRYQ
jgi:hypothetical protein